MRLILLPIIVLESCCNN